MSDKGKVFVTGGAGYIGAILTEKLLNKGYKVSVLDAMFFGEQGLGKVKGNPGLEIFKGRTEDREVVGKAVKGCDFAIHLAGLANDASCDYSEKISKAMNYDATKVVLEESRNAGVQRFLYGSSAGVYGAGVSASLTEESPLNPKTTYQKYRIMSEEELFKMDGKDFCTCALRKSTVFGYSPRQRLDIVVNAMTAFAINRGSLVVYGGDQWRPNLYVGDAADCYLACLKAGEDKIRKEAFNVGSNSANRTINQIADMVAEEIPGTRIERKPNIDRSSYNLNFDKMNKQLGFEANTTVKEGIRGLKEAFEKNLLPDYESDIYYNRKRLERLDKEGLI